MAKFERGGEPTKITFMHFGGKVFDFKYIDSLGLL